jgi:hypothetical protein
MAQLIAAAATAVSLSTPVVARTNRHVTVFAVPGLAGAVATIEISPDNGQTWMQSAIGDLTNVVTTRLIDTPGLYRVNKGATVSPTAIYAATEDNA